MKKFFPILTAWALAFPILIFAQGYTGGMEKPPQLFGSINDVFGLLDSLLGFAWAFLSIVVVLMFLWAGFKFITARGDEKAITDAKSMVKNALIGVAVMLVAGSVLTVMRTFITG